MNQRKKGYTLVEVMTAMVVMTIGATGIIAMQGASVRANQDANETSVAVNFASTWVERVKRDARRWTANGSGDLAVGNNDYLSQVLTQEGTWRVPAATAPEQAAADYFGFDTAGELNTALGGTVAPAFYCANLALTVVQAYNPLTGGVNATSDANAIRADVRVWWYRNSNDVNRALRTVCRGSALTPAELAAPQIRRTYLSTVVSWRTPGWP